MLIDNKKTIIQTDTYLKGYFFINETTEEGKLLAQKIIENYPYFDFVLDEEGNLIDVTLTEKLVPEPVTPVPTSEERLEALEMALLLLL